MSDVSPYGTHQHAAPGAVREHAYVGEPIDMPTQNGLAGASQATFSTAPYKKPISAETPRGPKGCVGKDGTCGAPAIRGERHCIFHLPGAVEAAKDQTW